MYVCMSHTVLLHSKLGNVIGEDMQIAPDVHPCLLPDREGCTFAFAYCSHNYTLHGTARSFTPQRKGDKETRRSRRVIYRSSNQKPSIFALLLP